MDLVELKNSTNGKRHPWEIARLEVVRDFLAKDLIPDFQNKKPRILDIGCGDGFVVNSLAAFFPKGEFVAYDIHFSQEHLDYLNSVKPANVSFSNSLHKEELVEPFDIVLLLDVLEHINDDHAFLKSLLQEKYISSNTLVFITVPAFQALFSHHDDQLVHFRRYSRRTLINTIKNAGFKPQKSGYFFSTLIPPRIVIKLKEKFLSRKSDKIGISAWEGGKYTTRLIKTILVLDYHIGKAISKLGIPVPGLSAYSIFRK